MKINITPVIFMLVLLCFLAMSQVNQAQAPPPPPTSGSKGDDTNKGPGGGAPVAGGVAMSLVMIAGYGAWKWVRARQNHGDSA
jgi:hypothetical protein